MDPSINTQTSVAEPSYVGHLEAAYNTDGKTVFETKNESKIEKRKRWKNDKPEDLEGFLGPWGKYEDEKLVAQPTDVEKAEIEEMMAKKQRRNKREVEEKPIEEKSILHSEFEESEIVNLITTFFL